MCSTEASLGSSGERRRVRRAKSIVAYWQGEGFVLENYIAGTQSVVPLALTDLIGRFNGFFDETDLLTACPSLRDGSALIDQLLARKLLVQEGSPEADREDLVEAEWKWGIDARFFHFSTTGARFECNDEEVWRALKARASEQAPPSPFKDYSGESIPLPQPRRLDNLSLGRALLMRRTARSFCPAPISRQRLADLLWWTWGKTHTIEGKDLGDIVLKTSPSGGARHPIEVYPIVLRVEGMDPGVYHYSVRAHALSVLERRSCEALAVEACSGQAWLRETAVVFVMTAVLGRLMWKYHHSHAFRVLHMDAGHLGQTFQLVCTVLGLGPFISAATNGPLIQEALRLDGVREIPLYAVAAGTIAQDAVSLNSMPPYEGEKRTL